MRIRFLTVLLMVLAALPAPALAWTEASATGSFSSWEEEAGQTGSAQSLSLKVLSRAENGRFRATLDLYGRAASGGDGWAGGDLSRLYALSLTGESLDGSLSATLGRQMMDLPTGSRVLDGLSAKWNTGEWEFSGRWGEVADVGGGSPTATLDCGVGGRYRIRDGMYLSLDYDRTTRDGALQTEDLALDYSYSWFRFSRAFITLDYDLMSRTFARTLFGSRLFFSDRVSLTVEHQEGIDSFESSDIYSVFAVDAARTTSFDLLLTASPVLRYHWEYALESYQSGGGGRRYTLGGRWTPGTGTLAGESTQQRGDFGRLSELSLSGTYPLSDRLSVGGGGDLARSQSEGEETATSTKTWLGADWQMGDGFRLSGRVENTAAEGENSSWAGRLAIRREL